MGWRGFNCTIPHKVAVIRHLDRLTPAAELIGAVNCVVWRDELLLGDNTDGKGFLEAIREVRPIEGLQAVILGAGGAARAIAFELALAGAKAITIVNRTTGRGEDLVRSLSAKTKVAAKRMDWSGQFAVPAAANLLVNATSIGLFPNVDDILPVDLGSLRPELLVCDVIPNPPRTRFLRDAEKRGCTVLDGLSMLVNQGVIGIRLWSGQDPSPKVMRKALNQVFHES